MLIYTQVERPALRIDCRNYDLRRSNRDGLKCLPQIPIAWFGSKSHTREVVFKRVLVQASFLPGALERPKREFVNEFTGEHASTPDIRVGKDQGNTETAVSFADSSHGASVEHGESGAPVGDGSPVDAVYIGLRGFRNDEWQIADANGGTRDRGKRLETKLLFVHEGGARVTRLAGDGADFLAVKIEANPNVEAGRISPNREFQPVRDCSHNARFDGQNARQSFLPRREMPLPRDSSFLPSMVPVKNPLRLPGWNSGFPDFWLSNTARPPCGCRRNFQCVFSMKSSEASTLGLGTFSGWLEGPRLRELTLSGGSWV